LLGEIPESKGSRPIIIIGHVRLPVAAEELIPYSFGVVLGERSLRNESDVSVGRRVATFVLSDIVSLHNEVDIRRIRLGNSGVVRPLCLHCAIAWKHRNWLEETPVKNATPHSTNQSVSLVFIILLVVSKISLNVNFCCVFVT